MHYSALWASDRFEHGTIPRTIANVSNVPSEARENEAVIAEVSRYGGVAKSRLFASYIPVGMRVVSV